MMEKCKNKIFALSLVVSLIMGSISGGGIQVYASQGTGNVPEYTNYPTNETVANYRFGSDITEETMYTAVGGYGFGDVGYPNQAPGWVGGVYYPRISAETGGVTYVKPVENVVSGKKMLEISSKVWTETESTGYGVYTYENTSAFYMDLPNADYEVTVTLENPTESAYTAYLKGENITKTEKIVVAPGSTITKTITVVLVDGKMGLEFLVDSTATEEGLASIGKAYVSAVSVVRQATNEVTDKPTIFIASDSTVQTYDSYYYPQAGWGETLHKFFGTLVEERECENCSYSQAQTYETNQAIIENRAIGGRSSKSFLQEGKLDDLLEDVKPGDYVLVQWGHNDATTSRPNRYVSVSEFPTVLKYYIDGCRQRGATPVLVTPVARYSPNADGTFSSNFEGYRQAMITLGAEQNIPVLDLTGASIALCESFGVEGAKALFLHLAAGDYTGAYAGGVSDSTHLQYYGAYKFAQCVAKLVKEYSLDSQLDSLKAALDLKLPENPPAGVTGLEVLTVGATSASFCWDKAEGAELYYIYRAKLEAGQTIESVDFTNAVKYSMNSLEKFTDKGLKSGESYVYAVRAFNEKGMGEFSSKILITTKSALYRYDFDSETTDPVISGWNQVTKNQMYNVTSGYGWIKAPGNGRNRANNGNADSSAMADDFCLGEGEFAIDLPNGDYEVVIYAGDLLPGTSTIKASYTAEGISIGTISVKMAIGTVASVVRVTDGQMNVGVGGTNAYINGMEITPLLLAPKGLLYQELQFTNTKANFLINFEGIEEAVSYHVYQKSSTDETFRMVKEINASDIGNLNALAMSANIGETVQYYVTAVTADGSETAPSNTISIEMVDPNVLPPGKPSNLQNVSTQREAISIKWDAVDSAITYNIYRSTRLEGTKGYTGYKKVGVSTETFFVDNEKGLTTNVSYYYKVQATGLGGTGALSDALTTPITEALVRQNSETLTDRALVAVDLAGNKGAEINLTTKDAEGNELTSGVYLSWRLFESDPKEVTFSVYKNDTLIASNLTVTNCVDPTGTAKDRYKVVGSSDTSLGVSVKTVDTVTWDNYYLEMQLQKPADQVMPDGTTATYSANDMSVGDLNGDGDYELIVKWAPSNGKDNSGAGYTGTTILDGYDINTATGEAVLLWRIDLGVNIRSGAHYTQFQVWDYDGDGSAEVICKTADGSTTYQNLSGTLTETGYVGACNAQALPTSQISVANDYRNTSGYILAGPEYLTIFEGATGKILTTTNYLPARGSVDAWGDAYGNRVDRFLSGTAYLDGEKPSAVFARGYYTRTCLTAYDFVDTNGDGRGDELKVHWTFDTNSYPNGRLYEAQGNHGLSINDVDGDGKDEIIYGSLVLESDGSVKYSTNLGHGDAMHISDWIPSREGLEIFAVHEHADANYQIEIHDAETGEVLWGYFTGIDTGRGVAADIDPYYEGAEIWANAAWDGVDGGLFSSTSTLSNFVKIAENTPSVNFSLFWDGDLLSELQDHKFINNATKYEPVSTNITKWNYQKKISEKLLESTEIFTSNGTKGNMGLVADILGDWREEIIARSSKDASKIRIYTSTIQTEYTIPCLMENDAYRMGIAWQNVGYNQPANVDYLLSEGLKTSVLKTGKVTANTASLIFTKASDGIYGHEITGYEIYRAGEDGNYTKFATLGLDDLIEVKDDGTSIVEPVEYKFDFGSKELQEGWIQINAGSPTFETQGTYGFTEKSKGFGYSDKSYTASTNALSAMYNDCVLGWKEGDAYEFNVAVPNGTYEVTYYTFNGSGSQYNQVTIEGVKLPDIRRGKTSISELNYTARVEVVDGTLNVTNICSKSGNLAIYFNGLTVKQIVEATEPVNPSQVTYYGYTDTTVKSGTTYSYQVAPVVDNKTSYVSQPITLKTVVELKEIIDFELSDIMEDPLIPEGGSVNSLLPATIQVLDKDGKEATVPIVWDSSKLNSMVPGVYEVIGTIEGYADPIVKTVKVIPNAIASYEFVGYPKTSEVEPYYTTEVAQNTPELVLPSMVTFHYLNGKTEESSVLWDKEMIDLTVNGTYVASGSAILLAGGGKFGTQTVQMKVVVKDDFITGFESLPAVEVAIGSSLEELRSMLPVCANAIYKSGTVAPVLVNWNLEGLDGLLLTEGSFVVSGTTDQSVAMVTVPVIVCYKTIYKFDFGISDAAVEPGWTGITVNAKGGKHTAEALNIQYMEGRGFGFINALAVMEGRYEEYTQSGTLPASVYKDFVLPAGQTFRVDVPNGTYQVEFSAGSAYGCRVDLTVEGGDIPVSASVTNAANTYNIGKSSPVIVKDGKLSITFAGNTPRLNMLIIRQISLDQPTVPTPTPTPGVDPTPTPGVDPTPTPGVDPTPTPGVDPTPTPSIVPTPAPTTPPSPPEEESKDLFVVEGVGNVHSWNDVVSYLKAEEDIKELEPLVVTLGENSVIPKEVFDSIRGKDRVIKVQFEGYSWTIAGTDITSENLRDIDLSVNKSKEGLPDTIVEELTKQEEYLTLQLVHHGVFGFSAMLSVELPKTSEGRIANLFYYNPVTGKLELESVGTVDETGKVELKFTHASSYVVVIEDEVLGKEKAKEIEVSTINKTLYYGGTQDNTTKIEIKLPEVLEDAMNEGLMKMAVSHQSENEKIATVSKDGLVLAKGVGKTTITTSIKIADLVITYTNTIIVKAAHVKILNMCGTMQVGKTFQFKVKSYGYGQEEIKYTTEKTSIVVISKSTGKAQAVSKGTDYVIIQCGPLTRRMKVTVN